MSDDDLKRESKIITKDLLETAIKLKEGCDELIIDTFTIKKGGLFGDNFASVAFSVKVSTTDKNGKGRDHDLFLKIAHDNELGREWTFDKSRIFEKENKTYSCIVPDMIRYQTELGIEPFGPSVPEYYYGIAENYIGVIMLQDIRPCGYQMAEKRTGLDYKHCELVMRKLAAFHVLSYALKKRNPETLKKYDFIFHESMFATSVPVFLIESLKAAIGMMKACTTNENIIERVEKLLSLNLHERIRSILKPTEPYGLICHGDMWCNNMLFKYDSDKDKEIPLDVKLVDLQFVRYALPSTDLVYFFYTSTTRDTRKKYMQSLLHIYHSAFMKYLEKLNLDFPEFTFDVLDDMVKNSTLYGVLIALMALPTILAKPTKKDSLPDFDGKTPEEMQVMLAAFFKELSNIPENQSIIQERLLGAAEDGVEMGII